MNRDLDFALLYHRSSLQEVVEAIRKANLVRAEASAIFVIEPATPGQMVLAAAISDQGAQFDPVPLAVKSEPRGGLTGHIAFEGRPVRLHGAELTNHPNNAHAKTSYIKGDLYSLLAVPVNDGRGRVSGLLKFTNRQDENGRVAADVVFTPEDEVVACAIASILTLGFESTHLLDSHRAIVDVMARLPGREAILNAILAAGKTVLRADRGDVVVWNDTLEQLVVAAVMPQDGALKVNQEVVQQGFVHGVWMSPELEPRIADDVAQLREDEYYAVSPYTRSEAAVPIYRSGKKLGVLNLESFLPKNFGDRDRRILEALANYAGLAVSASGGQTTADVARFISEPVSTGEEKKKELDRLLEDALDDESLAAVLFYADDLERELNCVAAVRVPSDATSIKYRYEDSSFATKVRKDRESLFANIDSPDVYRPVAVKCGIRGRLLGIPLLAGGDVVGVLVVWKCVEPGQEYWQTEAEREEIRHRLQAPGTLWAYGLRGVESARRKKAVLEEIQNISAWGAGDLDTRLERIGMALHADGFDRVRLFLWDPVKELFRGRKAWGMSDSEGFRGKEISPSDNLYTRYTVDHALYDPSAVLFDPLKPKNSEGLGVNLGTDPHAHLIEKDATTPWAVVPMVFNGTLYGQIAADTRQTGRRITQEYLQYMTVIGALAAQIIATEEVIERETSTRVEKTAGESLEVLLHTLKTPIHSIFGYFGRMQRAYHPQSEDQDQIGHWMKRLDEQLIWLEDLMRDADGFVERMRYYQVRPENLLDIVREVHSMVEPLAVGKRIRVEIVAPERQDCDLAGDRDVLHIIIQNLVENAIKFSPRGSRVEVRITPDTKHRRFRVGIADEGPGMTEEDASAAMGKGDAFPRLVDPETRGLGLAIARALAVRAHGDLRYIPRVGGRGATFVLMIPARSLR